MGAADALDAALLRLCQAATGVTVQAGNEHDPPLSATQIRALTLLAGSRADGGVEGAEGVEGAPGGEGVDAAEGVSLTAVAAELATSVSSASRICKRLVRDGLVDRAAGPGNELRLSLSNRGARELAAVNRRRLQALRSILGPALPAVGDQLVDLLDRLLPPELRFE